jgi:riboflavin kinase/FMN adenylyltransferase
MRHYWSLEDVHLQDTWLTIGTFDGVHRGHQEIVRNLAERAHKEDAPAVVLTFYPHPAVVLGKRPEPFYLTTPDERADLLGSYGIDAVVTMPFTPQFSQTTARDFIELVNHHIQMRHLLVGADFALGRDREGNAQTLTELGEEFGYQLEAFPAVEIGGRPVSSSRIRAALAAGNPDEAAILLGRHYHITGQVVPGDGRGRTIGIPTANLNLWPERAILKSGVYVTRALVKGREWGSVTNIGIRPTFSSNENRPHVETHLLEFEEEIYGQDLRLTFLTRLRDEQRFPSVDALVAQIQNDISQAWEILGVRSEE